MRTGYGRIGRRPGLLSSRNELQLPCVRKRFKWTGFVKRTLDLLLAVTLAVSLAVPLLLIFALVRLTSAGPACYWSDRVGKNNKLFKMPKFRSMREGTPEVATSLLTDPENFLTPVGGFLRRSSLDELPQLWSIIVGDMSFVGPRPALHNQLELIELRTRCGVHKLVPGLTGWAQINGRDELLDTQKVALDKEYLDTHSLWLDAKIIMLTAIKVIKRDGIVH